MSAGNSFWAPSSTGVTRIAALFALLAGCAALARAAVRDSFESPDPTWAVADRDCSLRMLAHRRRFDAARSGNGCEYLHYWTGAGTTLYLAHATRPARVIDELIPSLWVKSNQPHLQLLARVVFPRSLDERTGRPVTALLRGDVYRAQGTWQQLRIDDIRRAMNQQLWVLRSNQREVDPAEAYLDMLVLNAYGGPGETELWIDDLELSGFAEAGTPANGTPASGTVPTATIQPESPELFPSPDPSAPARTAHLSGDVLSVGGRPFLARMIDYNGESFAALASLGFNIIKLSEPPSRAQRVEAERQGVWLIAPPPPDDDTGPPDQTVLAWDLGAQRTARDLPATRDRAARIREQSDARPLLLVGAAERIDQFALIADLLLVGRPLLGTSFQMHDYGDWLRSRIRQGPNLPIWAGVQTELTSAQRGQIAAMGGGAADRVAVEPEQIWWQAIHAVAAGARGLHFRSSTRLDTEPQRGRALALRVLNLHLDRIEPWILSGRQRRRRDLGPHHQLHTLDAERSKLMIVLPQKADQQLAVRPLHGERRGELALPEPSPSAQAYTLTTSRLRPLTASRTRFAPVSFEPSGPFDFVVETADPLVVNHLGRTVLATKAELAERVVELAEMHMADTRRILGQLPAAPGGGMRSQRQLLDADALIRRAQQVLRRGDLDSSTRFAEDAFDVLRQIRWTHWRSVAVAFPTPTASPLCMSFNALPAHFAFHRRVERARWSENRLPAGDFESLPHLLNSGWTQERAGGTARGDVELSPVRPRQGRSALRLATSADDELHWNGRTEAWPLWIASAPVRVRQGQIYRIEGWVRSPGIRHAHDGLMIFDSLSGPQLAERVHETKGWRAFTLYRCAPSSGDLRVIVAMTGLGEAYVDHLTITLLNEQPTKASPPAHEVRARAR